MFSEKRRTGSAKIAVLTVFVMVGSSPGTAAPLIRGQHYNDQRFLECSAAAECTINFAQVPANRFLIITQVTATA
jgi:hypothetical protein